MLRPIFPSRSFSLMRMCRTSGGSAQKRRTLCGLRKRGHLSYCCQNNWEVREMRFRITSIIGVVVPVLASLFLAGCLTGGGGGPTYDGTWTVGYVDSGFTPTPAVTGATVTCTVQTPLPTITLTNGTGSTSQTNTCISTTATSGVVGTQTLIYLISVAVTTSTSAVNAIVNGAPLTGQCISALGCAAQSGTKSLSLTR